MLSKQKRFLGWSALFLIAVATLAGCASSGSRNTASAGNGACSACGS